MPSTAAPTAPDVFVDGDASAHLEELIDGALPAVEAAEEHGTTVEVESTCPTTGSVITLEVSPERVVQTSHPEAVVSFLERAGAWVEVQTFEDLAGIARVVTARRR